MSQARVSEAHERRRAIRAAAVVEPRYPAELPVAARRQEILDAIRAHQVVVVQADTGSGKTTQLPKMLLELGYGVAGEIAHTQPRRLAARATAARIASELSVPLGSVVGCQVRFDDRSDQTTRLRVLTDGVLLAQLAQDRLLRRYDAIVIDEVHERSLNVDFLLGSLRGILPRRPELRLVLASATMEADRLAAAFGGAPVLSIPGRLFPVEVRWCAPAEGEPADAPVIADAVESCLQEGPGDVLVFLPGEREIMEAVETLRGRAACRDVDVLPLFGRLGDADQDRAIAGGSRRRVTVATNVAETSLTVPGIRWVVDAGLVRLSRWSSRSRVQRLLVEPAAKASLEQRKGRAGRVAPGVCVRLFDQADFAARADAVPPEILRSNLAGVVLRMKDLGLGDPAKFPFIDPPGERRLHEAEETLREIGAVGARGELTRLGRQMARLPVDPRVARVLLEGVRLECGAAALTLAAWLSAVDPRERPPEKAQEADLAHQPFRDGEGDLIGALRLWQAWQEAQGALGSSALKRWCRERHLSHRRLREWTDVRRQLDRLLRERLELDPGPDHAVWRASAVHRAVLAGYASQVALKGRDGLYRLADGSTFTLHPRSGLARSQPPWVVALEVVDTGRRQARVVARIQPTWVERAAPHLMKRTLSEPHWVMETGQVAAWERVSMGQLDLVERRRVPYGPVNPVEARVVFIRSALVEEQLGMEAGFLRANRDMRDQAEAWAQARRRSDLLADAESAYAFYDARVPASVHSRPDFERWRTGAEARQPSMLLMQRSDLVTDVADDEAFPRALATAAGEFAVAYRHAPGTVDDGMTVTVPLVAMGDVDAGLLEWSVPGRRGELVQALIRSLPKRVRVRFQPVEEFSEGFLQAHQPADGPLRALLARHLAAASGLEIVATDFDMNAVPQHLLPRLRIMHGDRVRAEGRDLERFRHELAGELATAREALMRAFEQGRWCGQRQEGWPAFAPTLPVPLEVAHSLGVMRVWGTLAAVNDGVESVWCGTASEAVTRLEAATLHWMHARLRSQVQHHLDFDPGFQPLQWSARGLGSPAGLVHAAAVRSVQIACVGEGAWPRSEQELQACIDRGGAGLLAASRTVLRVLEGASRAAERIRGELDRPSPADWSDLVDRTRHEMEWLLGPEGLERSSPRLFQRLPELLQACVDRVQRLGGGGAVAVRQSLEALQAWQEIGRTKAPPGLAGRRFREMVLEAGLGLHARGGGPWPRVRDLERAWAACSDEAG
ncbi:MAG: ATP-dependent RNA helicase HrpA [Planctomycetes bacterium]|nr:ATP-dependent RNA helicase HrpA [Planctomycetota bacterium]